MDIPPITVPQADPGAGYRALKLEIDAAVARALSSGWYILGREGEAFESEFAAWLGARRAVGCANGTDALELCLRGLGIGPGATVVTVSHTAVATVAAIERAGATPLLVDVDPLHYTMDPAELAEVLDHPPAGLPPIRAVIPVHLYGQPADLAPIMAARARHGVAVIEDCSQAHGATLDGRKVGTLAEAAAFSLYPTKNLGALGDGGIVAARDAALAERIAALRQYGWRRRYISDEPGVNSRLDELQAAILRVKLARLDAHNVRRAAIAARYDAALSGGPINPPARQPGATHVFHQYVLRAPDRDALAARLRVAGVATAVHYPMPVHAQPAYSGRVALGPSTCRESARAAREVLSLPMFPEMSDAQIDHVGSVLAAL
jgi:dTDP-4-amino-4,6-dideoxygalactose transaminase